ncbi:uncharacterized protein [Dermacentor albipictus]|uniref:uncharacterized protein n=1 Tax=Dermacentor albipictus TaxID=60249 RepID=UPI0038FC3C38
MALSQQLLFATLNVRGLRSLQEQAQLRRLLSRKRLDFVAVQETKITGQGAGAAASDAGWEALGPSSLLSQLDEPELDLRIRAAQQGFPGVSTTYFIAAMPAYRYIGPFRSQPEHESAACILLPTLKRSARHDTMKQIISVLCLIGCVAICASSSELEKNEPALDVVIDQQSRSVGVQAIQVGEVLRAISQGLRDTAQPSEHLEHESEEYFFKKLWKKAKNAVKQVGKVVEKGVKGVVTSKAADIVKKFLEDKLSVYALEDGKTYNDFRHDLAKDFERVGSALIEKGTQLCTCRGRRLLDEKERKFVQGVVEVL